MRFQKIQLSDKETFDYYFSKVSSRICDKSFAASYVWKDYYNEEFAVVDDMLVIKAEHDFVSFSYPIGHGDVKKALDEIRVYCKENDIPFCLHNITKENEACLEEFYPGEIEVLYSRDDEDYIYESKDLITLKGKKFHGKRNHINKFKENHEWSYESISDANRQECLEMLEVWKEANCETEEVAEDDEKNAEACAAKTALMYMERLGLVGGAIRAEGKIIAFAMGEPINEDTFVVHFEKAFGVIQGAYPMINQQFAEYEASEYRYINREEDCGEEGLRKAKLSYRPVMMAERGMAFLKAEAALLPIAS